MRLLSCVLFLAAATVSLADDKSEDGFTPIFNGKDLTGWKTFPMGKDKDKPGDPLDGKTEAFGGRFKVVDGALVLDPKVKGDLYIATAKEYAGDVTIRFEFNPGPGCNNDLLFRGAKFDIKKDDVKNLKEGEWNQLEVVLKGTKAEFKVNGESIRTIDAKAPKGPFVIRAEFGPITIRKIRVKEGA